MNTNNISDNYYNYTYEHYDALDIEEIEFKYKLPQHIGKIAYLAVIFVVSMAANIILIVQQLHKIRKPVQNRSKSIPYMLISLAVANIISTFFTILVHAVWFGLTGWYAGSFMCKNIMFFRAMEHFVRPFSVVSLLMAYIAERVTKKNGKTTAMFFILPAWVIGCLLSLPMFVYFDIRYKWHSSRSIPQCTPVHVSTSRIASGIFMLGHLLSMVVLGFVFPCIISAILCCVTCCIGKKGNDSEAVSNTKIHYNSTTQECTHDNTPLEAPTQPEHIKPNHLPLVINIIFFVMYLPFFVIAILSEMGAYRLTWHHVLWMYFTGTSSVAVTAVVAILGSLDRYPKCTTSDGFNFKRIISDV